MTENLGTEIIRCSGQILGTLSKANHDGDGNEDMEKQEI